MQLEGKVGRQTLSAGAKGPIRQNSTGDMTTEQGGRYAEACLAGRLFSIANQAKVATTDAFDTTWTGLAIGNPTGSGINMKVLRFAYGLQLASDTAGCIGLSVSATSLTASLTPVNRLAGGPAGSGLATAGQTLTTPVLYDLCGSLGTAATSATAVTFTEYWLDGSLVLTPGYAVCTYTTLDTATRLVFSFLWEEVDEE